MSDSKTEPPDHMPQVSVRLPPETIAAIDEQVKRRQGGPAEVTRASLCRYWIERGLKEEKRAR